MTFRLRLLGRFRLEGSAGEEIVVSSRKAQALLAILALSPERRLERERAVALLWGDRAEEQARGSLRQLLTQLRRLFDEDAETLLRVEGDWLGLSPERLTCDLWDFDALRDVGNGEALTRAEALWQGALLEGLNLRDAAFEDWLAEKRRYWLGRRQDVLQASLAQDPDAATARALLALDPLSETACRALMSHFAAAGERSQALQEYRRCQELLARELGAEPEAETQALYERILADEAPAPEPSPKPAAPASDKPAIAVLPFQNLSGDPEQLYFSDGISEDIVIALSRFHRLTVIARNSSFAYRDGTASLAEMREALGIDYLLEGSVRRAGNRVRVAAQLIDCAQGDHVWAERYDRDLEDIFAVQDELTAAIVAEVGGGIGRESIRRANRMSEGQLRAQDLVWRGRHALAGLGKEDNRAARQCFEKALVLDPGNAMAHAHAGSTHTMDWLEAWVADLPAALDRAEAHCREAVRLDPGDSFARACLGEVFLVRREFEASGAQLEEAVALNPNDSYVRSIYGWYLQSTGRTEAAVAQFDEGRVRDPFERSWYPILHGIAFFADRRYREAVEMLLQVRDPWNEVRGWLAAGYAYLGEQEKAAAQLAAFLDYAETDMAVFPGRRFSDWVPYWTRIGTFRDEADLEHLLEGLRRAGLRD